MTARFDIHAKPSWTPERVETLRTLWGNGLSANQIADRIRGFSRNAIIGKLHRLGLARGDKPKSRLAVGGRKAAKIYRKKGRAMRAAVSSPRRESAPLLKAESYVPPIMSETAPPNATPLVDCRNDQCRWPYGDTNYVFCPETQFHGSSYCPGHHVRVYAGIPAPKRRQH
jgi:GcrA cell cycle regulator